MGCGRAGGRDDGHADAVAGGTVARTQKRAYDGDGRWIKETKNSAVTYHLRAIGLGGRVLTELSSTGQKRRTNVYAGGEVLARQSNNEVVWEHRTPFETSEWETGGSGAVRSHAELDPTRADAGLTPPEPDSGGGGGGAEAFPLFETPTASTTGYLIDGIPMLDIWVSIILNFGEVGGGQDSDGLAGDVNGVDTVWVDAWLDLPAVNGSVDLGPDGRQGATNQTVIARNAGYFVSVPGRTFTTRLSPLRLRGGLDVERLKANLRTLLDSGDCAEWVKALISKAEELSPSNPAEFTNPLDRFDEFKFVLTYPDSISSVSGSLKDGTATVYLTNLWLSTGWENQSTGTVEDGFALMALHEMLHLAGVNGSPSLGYGDYHLARAAEQLPGSNPMPPWNPRVRNMQGYISWYWDRELEKHCNFKKM